MNPSPLPSLSHSHLTTGFAVGIFVFLLYVITLLPSLSGGDSGELIMAARGFGIAHPPGYPIYLLLSKLFSSLSPFSWAWSMNCFSAFCDSVTTGWLVILVSRLTRSQFAGVLAGLFFATSAVVWTYAVVAEVFPLNNLFCVGALWFFLRYWETSKPRWAILWAFWSGLGMGNHHAYVLFAIPMGISVVYVWIRRGNFANTFKTVLLPSLAALGVGLLPYAYLVVASRHPGLSQWGNLTDWQGFWTHFLRKEYGTLQLSVVGTTSTDFALAGRAWSYLGHFFSSAGSGMGWLVLGLVFLGAAHRLLNRKNSNASLPLLLTSTLFFYFVIICNLSNLVVENPLHSMIIQRFWQQPWTLFVVLAGISIGRMEEKWKVLRAKSTQWICTVALLIFSVGANWDAFEKSPSFYDQFGKSILEALPQNTILFTSGDDITGNFRYLQSVDKVRPDVKIVEHTFLTKPWYGRLLKADHPEIVVPGGILLDPDPATGKFTTMVDFLHANQPKFRVFLINGYQLVDRSFETDYQLIPEGAMDEFVPKNEAPSRMNAEWVKRNQEALAHSPLRTITPSTKNAWTQHLYNILRLQEYEFNANWMARLLEARANDTSVMIPLALIEKTGLYLISNQVIHDPENVFRNLFIGYTALSPTFPHATEGLRRAALGFLQYASQDHPDRERVSQKLVHLTPSLKHEIRTK